MKKMISIIISVFMAFTALGSFSAGAAGTDPGAVSVSSQKVTANELAVYSERVAYLINQARRQSGLNELAMFQQLDNLADIRSGEIVSCFDHHRPDGSPFYTVLTDAGFSNFGAGENIAFGQRTPEEVVTAWLNSEGHRKNIMNSEYKYIGVGVRYANNMYYWEQIFLDVDDDYPDAVFPQDNSGTDNNNNDNDNGNNYNNGNSNNGNNDNNGNNINNNGGNGNTNTEKAGDVNGDGIIDAVDASVVLSEYASISVGNTSTFSALQRSLADMNGDGIIDAVDASIILSIYAKNSVSG